MTNLLITDFDKSPPEPDCKGWFYRVRESAYMSPSNLAIVKKREYVPLRRRSCPGCSRCDYFFTDMQEREYKVIDNGVNGDIVELRVTNVSTDWETGYVDDWDLEFVVIEQAKKR